MTTSAATPQLEAWALIVGGHVRFVATVCLAHRPTNVSGYWRRLTAPALVTALHEDEVTRRIRCVSCVNVDAAALVTLGASIAEERLSAAAGGDA